MAEKHGIQVVVRLRPMSDRESKTNTLPVVTASTEKKEVTVIKGSGNRTLRNTFAFDNVFTSFSTQKEVFDETLAPVISDVLSGYESTVFAYGQTGTGKTHTMEGNLNVTEDRGVIPRAAFDVFRRLKSDQTYVEHSVTASFLEIYNEELCDLLVSAETDGSGDDTTSSKPSKTATQLRLVEDASTKTKKGKGVFVMGLTEENVTSPEDVLQLMRRASEKRQVGETKMNKQSSRSHCVFTMCVNSKKVLPDGSHMECAGKLHMVDLAGSECAKSAGGSTDLDVSRERERKNINQSLLTLGRVITLLKNGGKAKGERIPYRDSKLTRLLQESLGGRCKTCVIATISPSSLSADETLSTLQYAQSAHGIVNKPIAQSMLKLNVDGARPQTARGDGIGTQMNGQTQQDWAEMECRMHYLETQAEEAAAALARKHAEHSALVLRAETAEERVEDAEQKALEAENERVKTEELLATERGETQRLTTLLESRVLIERKLTAEARALLQMLDSFAEAANEKTAALEAAALEEQNKRVLSAKFGERACGNIERLSKIAENTTAKLKAAHAATIDAARTAYDASVAGAEAASAEITAAADGAVSAATEASIAAASDADAASARREKLAAKLSAAAKAAATAATKGAENAVRSMDAVLHAFGVGENALSEWSSVTQNALSVAKENSLSLTASNAAKLASGVQSINNAVDTASKTLAEQKALLDASAKRLGEFAEQSEARTTELSNIADATHVSSRAAAQALSATASALEASRAAHEMERSALTELVAEINLRVEKSSLAARAAAVAAETARLDATKAIEKVNADADTAAKNFSNMKRGAEEALGEANDAAGKIAKAARLAEDMDAAHIDVRVASEATFTAVQAAGKSLGDAAVTAFEATEKSLADFALTRPEVQDALATSQANATKNIHALVADANGTVDAVVGAVVKANEKEKAFFAEVDKRVTEFNAKTRAELRANVEKTTNAMDVSVKTVKSSVNAVESAIESSTVELMHGVSDTKTIRSGLSDSIVTHVRDVDMAHQAVAKVEPIVLPTFNRALSATPADDVVLAGGGIVMNCVTADAIDTVIDITPSAHDADVVEKVETRVEAKKSNVDTENAPTAKHSKPSSMAAMRAQKFAQGAKPTGLAPREVNR